MVPLVKKLAQMVKMVMPLPGTNGTNVTNQWYHWENPEHTHSLSDTSWAFEKANIYVISVF